MKARKFYHGTKYGSKYKANNIAAKVHHQPSKPDICSKYKLPIVSLKLNHNLGLARILFLIF